MKLTATEEEIMQYIWDLQRCTVAQIIKLFPEPRPPHSTVSSVVRILERKGFVDHKTYGRTHEYFPLIRKEDYAKNRLQRLISSYFQGSIGSLVSAFAKAEKLSPKEVEELRRAVEQLDHPNSNKL